MVLRPMRSTWPDRSTLGSASVPLPPLGLSGREYPCLAHAGSPAHMHAKSRWPSRTTRTSENVPPLHVSLCLEF